MYYHRLRTVILTDRGIKIWGVCLLLFAICTFIYCVEFRFDLPPLKTFEIVSNARKRTRNWSLVGVVVTHGLCKIRSFVLCSSLLYINKYLQVGLVNGKRDGKRIPFGLTYTCTIFVTRWTRCGYPVSRLDYQRITAGAWYHLRLVERGEVHKVAHLQNEPKPKTNLPRPTEQALIGHRQNYEESL